MSYDTYANLQTEIKGWLKRDSMNDTRVEGFISLAEAEMNRVLRTRNQEVRETFTLSSQYTDLTTLTDKPIDIRNIQINTDPVRVLEYRSPYQLDMERPHDTTGKPVFYTIHGDELEVKPIPDTSYTAEISSFSAIPALSDTNTTNWLLTNNPDTYLWGALYYGSIFIMDSGNAQAYKTLFEQSIDVLNKQEKKARYSGSPLSVRTTTGNP